MAQFNYIYQTYIIYEASLVKILWLVISLLLRYCRGEFELSCGIAVLVYRQQVMMSARGFFGMVVAVMVLFIAHAYSAEPTTSGDQVKQSPFA